MAINNKSGCLLVISGISLTAVLIGIALYRAEEEYYGIVTLIIAVPLFFLTYWYGNRVEKQEETERLKEGESRAKELISLAAQDDFELVVKSPFFGLLLLGLSALILGGLIFSSGINHSERSYSLDSDLIVIAGMSLLAGLLTIFASVIRLLYPTVIISSEGIKVPLKKIIPWGKIKYIEHFDYIIRIYRFKGVLVTLKNSKKVQIQLKNSTESSEAVYLVSKYLCAANSNQ